jgi:2-methylisocitrate lyase-like PEP mutase family enzyme
VIESVGRSLRKSLIPGAAVLVPGAANALAARIIERCGFSAIYVTGAGIANSYLGVPDIGLLTVTELIQHVAAMRASVTLPLIVDADTGFGNALNVARTVKTLEQAGANAIQIEDQQFPKKCGHFVGKAVIDPAEMAMKVKAAVDARRDPDFLVIARTDAIACNSFDDALARAALYREAGADLTFVEAPRSRAEIERIPQALACPQVMNIVSGGLTPMLPQAELSRLGYAMVLYANAALQAAMQAMTQTLEHLKSAGSLVDAESLLMDFTARQAVVGKDAYDALEQKYSFED